MDPSGDEAEAPGGGAHGQPADADAAVVPSRRGRLFAAADAKGVPLRTILTVDAVVIATWVLYRVVGRLREIILWALIAAFVAVVLDPAVVFLERHRFRRGPAVGMVFVIALLVFAGLLGLFGYPLVNSVTHVAEQLPAMTRQVEKGHGHVADLLQRVHLLSWVQRNAPKLQTAAHNLGTPALNLGKNLGKAVFTTILALTTISFLSLFMLLEAPVLREGLLRSLRPDLRRRVEDVSRTVSRTVSAYVLGTTALSLLFGLVIFLLLVILGVPFALLLGLWVALVAMIPLVGGLIAGVPAVIIALLHSPLDGVMTLVVFVVFQLVENHFLSPLVLGRTVQMNPLWVLMAVLVGANLGGVFGSSLGALAGALVAIPVGGAIQVVFREVWSTTGGDLGGGDLGGGDLGGGDLGGGDLGGGDLGGGDLGGGDLGGGDLGGGDLGGGDRPDAGEHVP